MTIAGGCSCGAVRYEIKDAPLFIQACHCTDCQRTSGSAFVVHAVMAEKDLEVSGETRPARLSSGSGNGRNLHFCVACGVSIWVQYLYHQVPVIALRTGTLDNPGQFSPQGHIFTRSKQAWVTLPDGVPAFPEGAAREEVWTAESIQRYEALAG
jgi:hypothetical protein